MKKSVPHRQLETYKIRRMPLDKDLTNRLDQFTKGFTGEKEVYEWLQHYGDPNWIIIHNFWFDYQGLTQCDFLVITEECLYIIEVKNYNGAFRYEDGRAFIYNNEYSGKFMRKLSDRTRELQFICSEFNPDLAVKSVMVLINQHCTFSTTDNLDFWVTTRNQFRDYINSMITPYQSLPFSEEYIDRVNSILQKYSAPEPHEDYSLPVTDFPNIPKGVTCPNCDSFEVTTTKKSIVCQNCGCRESKHDATIRSALQLRLLFWTTPEMITTKNVYEFMGGLVSLKRVRSILNSNFDKLPKRRGFYYNFDA